MSEWSPGIGDPTFMGWFAVVAYFLVGLQCAYCAVATVTAPRERWCWIAVALLLFFLGVNKQLDLQTLLTDTARQLAISGNWYERRRPVQVAFIVTLAACPILAYFAMRLLTGHSWTKFRLTALGLFALLVFIVVRAASFHHLEVPLSEELAHFDAIHLMELAAIGTISAGAHYWLKD